MVKPSLTCKESTKRIRGAMHLFSKLGKIWNRISRSTVSMADENTELRAALDEQTIYPSAMNLDNGQRRSGRMRVQNAGAVASLLWSPRCADYDHEPTL